MNDFSKYPKTDMFQIVNTLTLPHEYGIGPKHASWASLHYEGKMHKLGIRAMEDSYGPSCCVPGCNLNLDEHRVALVVEIDSDDDPNNLPELNDYLQACAPQAKEDDIHGFAFKQKGANENR